MNVRENKGITLIALVISVIVIMILAGVSLNATLGDNGIIAKAQNATYIQSCAVLEEFLKQYYASNYDYLPQDASNKAEALQEITTWIWNPSKHGYGNLGYVVTSEGKACYFIDKEELLKSNSDLSLVGGDAGDKTYASYSSMNDVYGVTSDLKVYYCSAGTDSMIGITEDKLDKDDPLREVLPAGSSLATLINKGDTSQSITAEDLKGIKELTIDTSSGVDLKELYNLTSLQKLTLTNYTGSLDGIQDAVLLKEIMLRECTISDYTALGKLGDRLNKLYLYMPTNEEIEKLCDASIGIATYDLPNLEYLGAFGSEMLGYTDYYYDYENKKDSYSNITSLDSLANLTNTTKNAVKYLFINNNKITNVRFLEGFTNLRFIRMENNQITSLAGVKKLNNLIYLHANNNKLGLNVDTNVMNTQTDALAECVNFKSIECMRLSNNANIKWISYLSNLGSLKYLYLDGCTGINVEDIKLIAGVIEQCGDKVKVPSKYALALLSNNTTVLDLSNQTVDEESFLSISDKTKINALSLKNLILVDGSGNKLSEDQVNTDINNVLKNFTQMQYLQLYGLKGVKTIDFVANMKKLKELDLRGTLATDLTKLNNITTIRTLIIDNTGINLQTIQATISRCAGTAPYWVGNSADGLQGFLCYNWSLVQQLKDCKEITNLFMYYHDESFYWSLSGGTSSNRPTLDLSGCESLVKFSVCRFYVDVKLPSNLERLILMYQTGMKYDLSECNQIVFASYKALNKYNDKNYGYNDGETIRHLFSTLNLSKGIEELDIINVVDWTDLRDLEVLKDCNLQTLVVKGSNWSHNTKFMSLNGIENLSNLQNLEIAYCDNITNIDALSNITTLKKVTIYQNGALSSIYGLRNCSSLSEITLNDNGISSLRGIENLNSITYINLKNNSLSDRYTYVDEAGNTVTKSTVSVLAELVKANSKLKTILLSGNSGIIDYSPLTSIGWNQSTGAIN